MMWSTHSGRIDPLAKRAKLRPASQNAADRSAMIGKPRNYFGSTMPKLLIVLASLVLAAAHPAAALDAVSMQLKWKHQFQFAGYYQALEQGFYRDAGLDVTIREGGPEY
jgi:NMT1/THI5 like